MFKTSLALLALFVAYSFAGDENYVTSVDLSHRPYRIIEKNVVGDSYGVFVLVAGSTSNRAIAVKKLMDKAGIYKGTNRCLINLSVERRIVFFLLGLVMIDTARADVIEFTDNPDTSTSE